MSSQHPTANISRRFGVFDGRVGRRRGRGRSYNVRRTTYDVQRTTYNVQRATYNVQRATCNVQRTTYNVRRTGCTTIPNAVDQQHARSGIPLDMPPKIDLPIFTHRVRCTLYAVRCTSYAVPRTLYVVPRTLYGARCRVYVIIVVLGTDPDRSRTPASDSRARDLRTVPVRWDSNRNSRSSRRETRGG